MKSIFTLLFVSTSFLLFGQGVTIPDVDPKTYGQNYSIGFHIVDGIGFTARKILKNDDQLELALGFKSFGLYDDELEEFEAYYGGGITIGYNFYAGNTIKVTRRKEKLKKHYFSIKAEAATFTVKRVSMALTWHKEMFFLDRPNASKGIDLGLRFAKYLDYEEYFEERSPVELFLRWDWNWFRN